MANGCCTNSLCADRETQLRLARLREELLTNFNQLLLDRIRFLEQTISQLSLTPPGSAQRSSTSDSTQLILEPTTTDRLSTPLIRRRCSSTTACFLQSPTNQTASGNGEGARSCPSSVDLSALDNRQRRFFSTKKLSSQYRASPNCNSKHLSLPMDAQSSILANDLASSANAGHEKGRLESRRFACDVDDNEVRAFKAMIYMEQARKQNARPLTRLRQALGMSTNSSTGSFNSNNPKKHSNA